MVGLYVGKYLEVGPSGRKGRYSLEVRIRPMSSDDIPSILTTPSGQNSLHMRTHAALEALHQKRL